MTSRVTSTLYDGLHPAAFFIELWSELGELVLVPAPVIDAGTRGRLLGALAKGKFVGLSSTAPDCGANCVMFCASGCAASAV